MWIVLLRSIALAVVVPCAIGAQQKVATRSGTVVNDPPSVRVASATVAIAARAAKPPVIDGKTDDAIWSNARVFAEFRTFDPVENGEPRFRTEARAAYDDHNL